jgi:hypothetical protein
MKFNLFKKNIFRLSLVSLISLSTWLIALPAKAICPVCVVAVSAGFGFSRWLGIDDAITGLWIGGLTVSLIIWTSSWLKNKKYILINQMITDITTTVVYYALIFYPMFKYDLIGHPLNKVWGVDKLIIAIFAGSLLFIIANAIHEKIKKNNNNKSYFPLQKVAIPVGVLLIFSFIIYLFVK